MKYTKQRQKCHTYFTWTILGLSVKQVIIQKYKLEPHSVLGNSQTVL